MVIFHIFLYVYQRVYEAYAKLRDRKLEHPQDTLYIIV